MLNILYRALNVLPEERGPVILLLGNGFFMGIFIATYKIASDALFVGEMEEYISEGIFVSGFLGVCSTALFVYLQNRISFSKLAILNWIIILSISASLYYALINYSDQYRGILVFTLYVLQGPLAAITLLGFWGIFGRLFDLRQSKRIIGGIDTGQLTAQILTFFAIGSGIAAITRTEDLLVIGLFSVIGSLIFLLMIIRKFNLNLVTWQDQRKTKENKFVELLRNNYVILLSLFLTFSVISLYLVENSFLNVLGTQYDESSGTELQEFIAWFYGSIYILSFIFQTFFNDKIISNYGLKVSLFILPVVLTFFTITSILAGTFFGFIPDAANTTNFFWFFLFIALSKLFTSFLRDSLENPTYKLYFMPLDNRIRFDIQAKVEGVVNEFAKFIAGGFIILLGLLSFFELIHYSYFLIIVIAGWMYITVKLYDEYRNRVKIKLESHEIDPEKLLKPRTQVVNELEKELYHADPEKAVFSFRLLEKIDPNSIAPSVNSLMKHEQEEIKVYAQTKLNELRGLSVSDDYVIAFDPSRFIRLQKRVVSGLDLENLFATGEISHQRISKLSRSENSQDRLYAAELISNMEDTELKYLLVELLGDSDDKVRITAMKAAVKNYNYEVLNAIIENLDYLRLSTVAANSLVQIGNDVLTALDSAFYRVGQSVTIMTKIIRILGRIGSRAAMENLWAKIDYPDKIVVSEVLDSLGDCNFKASIRQITRIKYAIENDIEDIAWNLAAIGEIPDNQIGRDLRLAIEEENRHDIEHIYVLLSMLYDSKTIQLVKENLSSRTSEGITYAIELLDVFLSDDLKQKIIPVLDDLPVSDKARKLEAFFPRESLGSKEVLKFLINRDYNQTNRWSKACALKQISIMKIHDYSTDLIANLFNPDVLVSETAAWALFHLDPKLFHENISRINPELKRLITESVLGTKDKGKKILKLEKVKFLKEMRIFNEVPGRILANLVDYIEEVPMQEGTSFSLQGNNGECFYIIYYGDVNYYSDGTKIRNMKRPYFIGELTGSENVEASLLIAQEKTLLLQISKEKFYEQLSDNFTFANQVIRYLYAS